MNEKNKNGKKNENEEKKPGQESNELVRRIAEKKYEFGFTTDVHTEIIDKGLNEDVIRLISEKKGEPDWLLQFRLRHTAIGSHRHNPHGGTCICQRLTIKPSLIMLTQLQKKDKGIKSKRLTPN